MSILINGIHANTIKGLRIKTNKIQIFPSRTIKQNIVNGVIVRTQDDVGTLTHEFEISLDVDRDEFFQKLYELKNWIPDKQKLKIQHELSPYYWLGYKDDTVDIAPELMKRGRATLRFITDGFAYQDAVVNYSPSMGNLNVNYTGEETDVRIEAACSGVFTFTCNDESFSVDTNSQITGLLVVDFETDKVTFAGQLINDKLVGDSITFKNGINTISASHDCAVYYRKQV